MTAATGRSLVVAGPGEVFLEERTAPVPAGGEVRVLPLVVGLCGTDLEIVDGAIDPAYVRYPLVLGHEWCGVIERRGGEATAEVVVAEGVVPCGRCERCKQGRTNLCEIYDEIGFTRDGAAAGDICVPTRLVHRLDPAVDKTAACLVEPSAVVYQALTRARPLPGWRVLVIGDGTVGLLALLLARLWSPAVVDLVGARRAQAELAMQAGADAFRNPQEGGRGEYDLVIEAAGTSPAVGAALGSARRGGVVLLLGLPSHGETTPVAGDDMVNRDLTVHASFSYTSSAFGEVASLVGSGTFDPSFLVTHRFPLEEWQQALEVLRNPVGRRGKVVLEL